MEGLKPAAEKKERRAPILEEEKSVAYLGVKLPKADNPENAPRQEQYADYINDQFSLELQRKIAVAWKQGQPILIEGGTSIGKTTTSKKMCADLGYEVHYVNLNGATDVEDLMGRYIPNHDRKSGTDPEYVFADGRVTSALRQEDGKIKVLLLDEYNAAAPNILIRLHEVLDALERNGEVVLAEDASEKVSVNKTSTKVVGLMNPPGRGYLQREPLDPAQIRRWVYHKEASELPTESLNHATRALFHLEKQTENVDDNAYLYAAESALTPEQFREIPGIEVVLEKYLEFHKGAKALIENRRIAKDQPQRFLFDDREEPKRVRDFIAMFYRGDINAVTQEALRYYYAGKILEPSDKQALEELIRTVAYVPLVSSKRVGLGGEMPPHTRDRPEAVGEMATFEQAEKLLGKDFFSLEKIRGIKVNGVPVFDLEGAGIIPFSKNDLERAKELNQQLYYASNTLTPEIVKAFNLKSSAATLENLKTIFQNASDGSPMMYQQDWYEGEDFFKNERPRVGWRLSSKEVLPETLSKNYLEQTDVLVSYLSQEVFRGTHIPDQFNEAIGEFSKKRAEIARLMDSDWQAASKAFADLKITRLVRELPVEAMYRLILNDQANKEKPLPSTYTWTASRDSDGDLVFVGYFDEHGAYVDGNDPDFRSGYLGSSFSRS